MKTTTTTSSISEAISQWFTTMIDHLFVFILGCATGRSQFHTSFYLEIVTYITHLSDASLPPSQMPAPKTSKGLFSNSNPTGTAKTKSNPGKRYIPTHDVLTIFLDVGRNSLLLCISFDFASCFKLQVFDLFYFCHVTLVCCVLFFFFFFFGSSCPTSRSQIFFNDVYLNFDFQVHCLLGAPAALFAALLTLLFEKFIRLFRSFLLI